MRLRTLALDCVTLILLEPPWSAPKETVMPGMRFVLVLLAVMVASVVVGALPSEGVKTDVTLPAPSSMSS